MIQANRPLLEDGPVENFRKGNLRCGDPHGGRGGVGFTTTVRHRRAGGNTEWLSGAAAVADGYTSFGPLAVPAVASVAAGIPAEVSATAGEVGTSCALPVAGTACGDGNVLAPAEESPAGATAFTSGRDACDGDVAVRSNRARGRSDVRARLSFGGGGGGGGRGADPLSRWGERGVTLLLRRGGDVASVAGRFVVVIGVGDAMARNGGVGGAFVLASADAVEEGTPGADGLLLIPLEVRIPPIAAAPAEEEAADDGRRGPAGAGCRGGAGDGRREPATVLA